MVGERDLMFDFTYPEFPDITNAPLISIDIETFDPELTSEGIGVRRTGYIIGIAVAVPGKKWYFPMDKNWKNDPWSQKVVAWANKNLTGSQPKLGAGLMYDLDYLWHYGIKVAGPYIDVQIAEALIDENQFKFNLEFLSQKYLGEGKEEQQLKDACDMLGIKTKNPKQELWRLPISIVASYAMQDADLPIRIYEKQMQIIENEGLLQVFDVECQLTEVLLHMRRRGVRIDQDKAEEILRLCDEEFDTLKKEVGHETGIWVKPWVASDIASVFDMLGIPYPRTKKTNAPSIKKDMLDGIDHPVVKKILRMRNLDKFTGTFIKGQILDSSINSRIHAEFNQCRGDDNGARTGRLSGSNPNMQFMPARDSDLGPKCRGIFIPDNDDLWGRLDYSQIELRILAHFALGVGAEDIRKTYQSNPEIDFHQMTADKAKCTRRDAKDINFGIVYGMGANKTAMKLGKTKDEAKKFLKEYNEGVPFLRHTSDKALSLANERGYVKTILGRRRRFPQWEPDKWDLKKGNIFNSKEECDTFCQSKREEFGIVKSVRTGTYRALNAIVQGSSADLMKKAMVDYYKSGVMDILGAPLLTVHDELDLSVPRSDIGREAFDEAKRIMEKAINFKVPVLADAKLGENWGECK
jgi:DNA polymerase-1